MTRRAGLLVGWLLLFGCGGDQSKSQAAGEPGAAEDDRPPVEDDRSLCVWRDRPDREVIESKGPGARFDNIRRVYTAKGQGQDRRRILVCREIDTNLDSIKDVVRNYGEGGTPVSEEADTNYDGKIDTWVQFAGGRVSRVETDSDGDGRADETRLYVRGELSRVHRDRNRDGRTDTWEVYAEGRLHRIGVDIDGDGHVDRWDRDELASKAEAAKEQEEAPEAPVAPTLGQSAEEAAHAKQKAASSDKADGGAGAPGSGG